VTIDIRLLGPIVVTVDASAAPVRGRQPIALLVRLALDAGTAVSMDRLVDDLWPATPPVRPADAVQVYATRLRSALGAGILETARTGYRLAVDREVVDAYRFERLVAAEEFTDALALWRGDALAELADLPFARAAGARWEEMHWVATEAWADACLAAGDHRRAVPELEAAVAAQPLREGLRAALALALYRSGRQGEALRCISEGRTILVEELGVEPGPSLHALEEAILAHDRGLAAPMLITPHGAGAHRLVGRDTDLADVHRRFNEVIATRIPHLVAITGEPGIGKSAVAAAVAASVINAGGAAAMGRCDAEGVTPFQPFVDILGAVLDSGGRAPISEAADASGSALSALLPGIDPSSERWRLFDAVVATLRTAADEKPLIAVIDDLHWADPPTLVLLRYLLRHRQPPAVLVVVTCRDTEGESGAAALATIDDLVASATASYLPLSGLDEAGVVALLGPDVAEVASLGARVRDHTGGNPFFVLEAAGELRAGAAGWAAGDVLPLSSRATAAVARRLSALPRLAAEALAAGATQGRVFDLGVIAAVIRRTDRDVVDALDVAVKMRLIVETAQGGEWAFAHDLIRDGVRTELGATRRALLHREIAAAIEQEHGGALGPVYATLAYHYARAVRAGGAARAVEYALLAGHHDLSALAYEQAAAHYERAHALMVAELPPDSARSIDTRLRLADARRRAGLPVAAADAARQAFDEARDAALAELIARAALLLEEIVVYGGLVSDDLPALFDDALNALPTSDSSLRALLLGRRPRATWRTGFFPAAAMAEGAREAIAMAGRLGDEAARVEGSHGLFIGEWDDCHPADRLGALDALSQDAARLGLDHISYNALEQSADARLQLGDVDGARAAVTALSDRAAETRQRMLMYYEPSFRATFSLISGDVEDAEGAIDDGWRIGAEVWHGTAVRGRCIQLFLLRYEQGRVADVEPIVTELAASGIRAPVFRCLLPRIMDACGRRKEAIKLACALVPEGLPEPRFARLFGLAVLGEFVSGVDDPALSARVGELLAPYRGQLAVSLPGSHGVFGPVDRVLGLLASAEGRADDAAALHAAALDLATRVGAARWIERSRADLEAAVSATPARRP
jgi:DNA-binding SARP family transcriptional activator